MSINTPREIVSLAENAALAKHQLDGKRILVLSFLAGAYIAFGGLLSIMVGGGVPKLSAQNPGLAKFLFGAMFPVGLMLVVLAGAELFTGNNAYFLPPVLSGKLKVSALLRNWTLVYLGNFLGAIFIAYFLAHLTQIVSPEPWSLTVSQIAQSKLSNPFYVTFLKGIGANWLVCLAMWLSMSSQQTSGKIIGMWWPVMAFVVFGFEHSIANMFFIPLAIFEGASVSWSAFVFDNLIAATLGNIVGGGFFVGSLYWFLYQKKR